MKEALEEYLKGLKEDSMTVFASAHDVIAWLEDEFNLDLTVEEPQLDEDECETSSDTE